MRKILLIGIGAGNPDYLTIQAVDALNRVDVFFVPDKGAEKAALRRLREENLPALHSEHPIQDGCVRDAATKRSR